MLSEASEIKTNKFQLEQKIETLVSDIAKGKGHLEQLDVQLTNSKNQLAIDTQELELKKGHVNVAQSDFDVANADVISKKAEATVKKATLRQDSEAYEAHANFIIHTVIL
ncbi:hypothetical protein [Vibrio caribbeanicus]|uniref:hypothetical protein n=1 Tax=Vibrio caribbeanicus TaxID=701175 RepID=UPI002283300A|nr:hypothetical protein [Vibrio caribbeanicus]MCY9844651.1 hypothetical protein [Vibrio caribbeanicus]